MYQRIIKQAGERTALSLADHHGAERYREDPPTLEAGAMLEFKSDETQGFTRAIQAPTIKPKPGELNSGQVLEARADGQSAMQKMSWSRLLIRAGFVQSTGRPAFSSIMSKMY